ncbi:AmmeMemoRadiSam system protein B [Candidatus Woesearchaeota archaeon]|nr:AmmeMemoRadiSam system protein B [Candidatus Woesearchaeota archaeon]
MTRFPIVAGQFYPAGQKNLKKQIEKCFSSEFGPGSLPAQKNEKTIGIISPHAGYAFSGPCQASAYKEIAESKADLFIILGLSHSGFPSCLSMEDWKTPFGTVKTDKEFQNQLSGELPVDESAHASEHSIEVQLPFLQFVNNKPRIAPIIASHDLPCKGLAEKIFKAIKTTNKKPIIIASSDFTHYGLSYGYMPFEKNIKENMYRLDKQAIKEIMALKAEEFLKYIRETKATICGKYPIAVLIELCKKIGAEKACLINYYTSGDIIQDYSSAVGYAAIKVI